MDASTKRCFSSMSLGSRTDESLLNLYTQYPTYLINAEGFNQAIEHCATKYNMDEESLKKWNKRDDSIYQRFLLV